MNQMRNSKAHQNSYNKELSAMNFLRFLGILFFSMFVASCSPAIDPLQASTPPPSLTASPVPADVEILHKSDQAVAALRDHDLDQLAGLVHPVSGLRFSPYAFVRDDDVVFKIEEVPELFSHDTVYLWGEYDGSGAPIELTFVQYFDEFIYDQDYADAEAISYNQRLGGAGGMINNIPDFYPGSVMVEYHFSGFEPKYDGLDWRSLRLVFMPSREGWHLVGIVHDEWTT